MRDTSQNHDFVSLGGDCVCEHCVHWDIGNRRDIRVYDANGSFRVVACAACKANALFDADAGDSVTLTAANGNCENHLDLFEVDPDTLAEWRADAEDAEAIRETERSLDRWLSSGNSGHAMSW